MKREHSLLRAWAMTLALLVGADAVAATATPNVTAASTSEPKLNGAGDAWAPFSNALGVPNSSKPIRVFYLSDDVSVYPLSAAGANIQLRPKQGGPTVVCTANPAVPVLTASNGGTCTFRIVNTAGQLDTLEVYHLGMLSGQIHLTATGLTASGGNTVDPYDSDTVLPGNLPTAAVGPPLSRKPAKLVLVYDRSGSMDWSSAPANAACGPTYSPTPNCRRWNLLKEASQQMISVAKAYALPTDKVGLVLFNHGVELPGGASLTPMGDGSLNAVTVALSGEEPTGNTSIGAGVDEMDGELEADNANYNNMTLLFTDGEQNTAPYLVVNNNSLLINPTANLALGDPWLIPPATSKLCVFRLRADDPAGPAGTTTLQQIANAGCDTAMGTVTAMGALPSAMIDHFVDTLNTALVGDKLEMTQSVNGEQAAPAGAAPAPIPMSFKTSKRDLAFTLLLSWDSAFQADGRPKISLSKDGVDFEPLNDSTFLVDGGAHHVSMTLRAPFCNAAKKCVSSEGEWKMQVTRTLPRGLGHWNLVAVSDNASIASRFTVGQTKIGVGEPLQLKAILTEGGKPLVGLPAGTVRAFISGPSQGLGNVLSASKSKPGEAPQADALSAAALKVQAMLADPAQRDKILAALELGAEKGIELKETSPGVYSAEYPATLAEGAYHVSFRIDSKSPDNGIFTRIRNTDHYVAVQPDDAATAKTIVHAPARPCPSTFAGGCIQVTLKPVDAKGNLVGPGKATSFNTKPFDGGLVGPVVDNLDGSYTLVIGYNKKGLAPPVLDIGGLVLNLPDSVGTGGKGDGKLTGDKPIWQQWWVWLIALLVLLILILLMRRK